MWEFNIGATFGAMRRTLPFIVLRMLVYFGVAFASLLGVGAGGAIGFGFGSFGDAEARSAGAFWGALVGFAGASGILLFAREYILYIVKAGHIAVLTKVYDGESPPGGKAQIEYAAAMVKSHFGQANLLFALDQIVKGVLRVLTGIVGGVAMFLPIPGLRAVVAVVNAIMKMSMTYVDEIILAHNLRTGSTNPWETSRQALVLYAQNYGKFLKNAVWLWLIMWLITIVMFFVFVGPALALLAIFPGNVGFVAFAVTFILAWAFKAALLEPFAIYALMQVYFKTVEGQVPNPEWDDKLSKASKKIRELTEKAKAYVPGVQASGVAPAPNAPAAPSSEPGPAG
jgi:hypothetical protein